MRLRLRLTRWSAEILIITTLIIITIFYQIHSWVNRYSYPNYYHSHFLLLSFLLIIILYYYHYHYYYWKGSRTGYWIGYDRGVLNCFWEGFQFVCLDFSVLGLLEYGV